MKYEKPEITVLGKAVETVQYLAKSGDHTDCSDLPTSTSYQGDE
jgi:hypothetical protein